MHTEYTFTRDTYYELQKRRLLFFSLFGLVGLLGVIAFIVLFTLSNHNKYYVILFIPTLTMLGTGIIFDAAILVMLHKLTDTEVFFTYDFFEEYMKVKSFNNGELTSDNEVYYNYIFRYKDTGKAFFFYLPNKRVMPLASDDPNLEEIKRIVHIKDIPMKKI